MIYTFSPNWYKPQCLHFSGTYMYYCSNYLLYRYDLTTKKVDSELCLRQIAIQQQINHKDIKINAISSDSQVLVVSINQPYLILIHKQSITFSNIVPLKDFIVEYIHPYPEETISKAILANKDGRLLKFNIGSQQELTAIEVKHKSSSLKYIYSIQNYHLAVFSRGSIVVYNQDFSVIEKVVQFSHSHTVFSVDCFIRGENTTFCFLTKYNESHFITLFKLNMKKQFALEHKKKIDEISDGFQRFEVNWYYPNKFTQKLKNNQKASMTVTLLSQSEVILTGKLGQVATLNADSISENTKVYIKPYSYEEKNEESSHYEVWPDSKHYKEIYWIYKHDNRIYMISTDHNLSVWDIHNQQSIPKYIYSIKFLTAGVQSFFYSEHDPRNIFALLKDSAIRCFTLLDASSHQINEFWKFSKKYVIKKAVCHPFEEGVLALLTQCNKIQIYDVYQDRLMKLIHLQEPALILSFEFLSIKQQIESMFKYELSETKLQYISHFTKSMNNNTVLMVQANNSLLLVNNIAQNELDFYVGKRQKRFERIHENRYWDQRTLLCSVSRKNSVDLYIRHLGTKIQHGELLTYNQGKVMFKSLKNSNQLDIYNFKANKISIKKFHMLQQQLKLELGSCHQVSLTCPIDFLHLNYADERMLVYSQRNDTLIVIDASQLKAGVCHISSQTSYSQLYSIKTKIDSFCFYFQHNLIMATKDQAIKVVDFRELQQLNSSQQQKVIGEEKQQKKEKEELKQP